MKQTVKRALAILALGTVFGIGWGTAVVGVGAQGIQPSRVAFVDVQRILARSAAGVAAREQLEREKAGMQKTVDGHRVEAEKLRDDLEKKGQLLSADARREKQENLERKVRDVRRLVDDLQKELQKKEQELLAKVLHDVSGIVQKIGKDRGYTLVVEKRGGGVVYGAPEADLTDEIVRAFDDETKKAKK
ncbi:MAG TPA: OmpH family outer membrane protein [Candidatus Limnocylindrales bacterium]|nr:OmpH family outer membrane protein [Candidatus Limnocylindrales bacterium]